MGEGWGGGENLLRFPCIPPTLTLPHRRGRGLSSSIPSHFSFWVQLTS